MPRIYFSKAFKILYGFILISGRHLLAVYRKSLKIRNQLNFALKVYYNNTN
jgi:hypothetical protein